MAHSVGQLGGSYGDVCSITLKSRTDSSESCSMETSTSKEVPTGLALEKARRRVGITTAQAATRLGISLHALGDYESGLRTPNGEMVDEMSTLYGIELGRLTSRPSVPRTPPRYDAGAGILWMGWNAIHIRRRDNEQILCSVAASLRSMRSLSDFAPVLLRVAELPLLAHLFDLEEPQLAGRLQRHLRVSEEDALALIEKMAAHHESAKVKV